MYTGKIAFNMDEKVFYSLVAAIIVIGGIGIGVAYANSVLGGAGSTLQNAPATGPYDLNLVEIMDANYNSSLGAQPVFYVLQDGQLTSTANISLPANRAIHISIVSYDMGNASVDPQFLKVSGTVGNSVEVINGTVAMGDNVSQSWKTGMTTFSASEVLHTFTILNGTNVLLNIPVIAGDTEFGTFYLNSTGSFTWQCEAACGSGPSGWSGPMSTPGWMSGTIDVE